MTIDLDNKEFKYAYDLINETNLSFFLTGKAGTGKSTFLKYIIKNVDKKILVVAPTGIAAVNIGGVTIHSFFQFPLRALLPEDEGIKIFNHNSEKRQIIESLDTLIIDEISMVRADIIDGIDFSLRRNGGDPNLPFGGKQVVFAGDLFQLEPVVKYDLNEHDFFVDSPQKLFFFEANAFHKEDFITVEFQKVYRQKDKDFIELLEKVRMQKVEKADLERLNQRVFPELELNRMKFAITLCSTRNIANEVNQYQLQNIRKEQYTYTADVKGNFESSKFPTEEKLLLKDGAQIMFIKNDSDGRWVNGTIGKINTLSEKSVSVELEDGDVYSVERKEWENVNYRYNKEKRRIEEETIGTFKQYPLKLAWAATIHKSQGLTFDRVIVDFGNGTFASGQAYVALSRATSFDGLFLKNKVRANDIYLNEQIKEFSKTYNNETLINDKLKEYREKNKSGLQWHQLFKLLGVDFLDVLREKMKEDKYYKGNNLLRWASFNGFLKIVEILLDLNFDVNSEYRNGITPLSIALNKGHYDVANTLLDRGADINKAGFNLAASRGLYDVVKFLLERGLDLNHEESNVSDALNNTSLSGHIEIVRILLDHGVKADESALRNAFMNRHYDIIRLLWERGADISKNRNYGKVILIDAAKNGHANTVSLLLEKGTSVNAYIDSGSALSHAIENGHINIVRLLLEYNVNINNDTTYWPPFIIAANAGNLEIVQMLIDYGADVNVGLYNGNTALMAAARNNHFDVAKLLLESGANANGKGYFDFKDTTPLILASENGNLELVKLLLDKGADVNVEFHAQDFTENNSALIKASKIGNLELVKLFLDKGADFCGGTPLLEPSKNGHIEIVKLLLEKWPTEGRYSYTHERALSLASGNGHIEVVRLIMRERGDSELLKFEYCRAIFDASKNGHIEIVKLLLEKGVDFMIKYNDCTSIEIAARYGHNNIVELLSSKIK